MKLDTKPRDFWNWVESYKKKYPNARFTIDDAYLSYQEVYSCDCISCNYRKERGHIPMRMTSAGCKLSIENIEIHPKHVMFMP